MNFFHENTGLANKRNKEKLLIENFKNENCKIYFVTNNDKTTSKEILVKIKVLFQKQLSKMPKEYILRQVFDHRHICLALVNKFDKVIGGICYRPFYDRNFFEIVFCAVDNNYQVKGIGSFMMNILKQQVKFDFSTFCSSGKVIRASFQITNLENLNTPKPLPDIGNIYLITYADNFAIGYFKKQGFTTDLTFDSWIGYIKDYEGGTLMECNIFWEIDYMDLSNSITEKKEIFLNEIKKKINYDATYKLDTDKLTNIWSIPGITSNMTINEDRREKKNCLIGFIEILLSILKNDPNSWPFLEPVNAKDVPQYYEIIKFPMDISTMKIKHQNNLYKSLDLFISDVHLMLNNCFKFNPRDSQYYICAEKLFTRFEEKLKFYEDSIAAWNLKDNINSSSIKK